MKFSGFVLALALAVQLASSSFVQAGSFLSRMALANATNSSLLLEDTSREYFFDANTNNILDAGDALVGYAKIDQTSPPGLSSNNEIYAVFSQTFGPDFAVANLAPGLNVYTGSFIATPDASAASLQNLLPNNSALVGGFNNNAVIAIIDRPFGSGFSQDLATVNLPGLGGVQGAITNILDAQGTVQLTAGIANPNDFFVFQSQALVFGVNDFVLNGIGITATVPTSQGLGNFGAGLSVTDLFLPGIVNRVTTSTFLRTFNGVNNFGQGQLYDLAIINGNFGGISQGGGNLVQGGGLNFINNADLQVNITVLPEPTSLVAWGLLGCAFAGIRARRRS